MSHWEPPRERRRLRRTACRLACLCAVAVGHAALLLLWRTSPPPVFKDVAGSGDGSGGIALSLVRGGAGGAFAPAPPNDNVDDELSQHAAAAQTAPTPLETTSAGVDSASTLTEGSGHGDGRVGEAADGAHASVGAGYDRGAYASLAPLSFTQNGDPKLWERVKRCLHTPAPAAVTLSVVIDGEGTFVDAYQPVGPLPTKQTPGEVEAIETVVQALKACGPYHDVAAGLGHPITLVVPASHGEGIASSASLEARR